MWEFRVYWEIMEIVRELNGALCPGKGERNNGEWAVNFSFIAERMETWKLKRGLLPRDVKIEFHCSGNESNTYGKFVKSINLYHFILRYLHIYLLQILSFNEKQKTKLDHNVIMQKICIKQPFAILRSLPLSQNNATTSMKLRKSTLNNTCSYLLNYRDGK